MRSNSFLSGSDILPEKVMRALKSVRGRLRIVLEVVAVKVHTLLSHGLDVEGVVGIEIGDQRNLLSRTAVVGFERSG